MSPRCRLSPVVVLGVLAVTSATTGQSSSTQGKAGTMAPGRTDRYGDPLPPGAVARFGAARLRHVGMVTSVSLSPAGDVLVSTGWDFQLRLWEAATGRPIGACPLDDRCWPRAVFMPDGKAVTTLGSEVIRLVDAHSHREMSRIPVPHDEVSALACSADGQTVASCCDKVVRLVDVRSGQEIRTLTGHKDKVCTVSFAANGRLLASGSSDGTVRLWRMPDGVLLRSVEVCKPVKRGDVSDGVAHVACAPDGTVIALGLGTWQDDEVKASLWDVATGQRLGGLPGRKGQLGIEDLAFAPSGRILAVAGYETPVRLWDLPSRKLLHELPGAQANALCFAPDGRTLACGDNDGRVRLWEVATGQERVRPVGHSRPVRRPRP